jgi:hypothetical protein
MSPIRTAFLFAEKRVPGELRPDLGPQVALDQPIGRRDDVERIALAGALRTGGWVGRDIDGRGREVANRLERPNFRRR